MQGCERPSKAQEAPGEKHLEKEAQQEKRREVQLEADTSVPRTMKGTHAPSESEKIAHDVSWRHRGARSARLDLASSLITPFSLAEKEFCFSTRRCNAAESHERLAPHTLKAVLRSCHTSYRGLQRGRRAGLATSIAKAFPQTFPCAARLHKGSLEVGPILAEDSGVSESPNVRGADPERVPFLAGLLCWTFSTAVRQQTLDPAIVETNTKAHFSNPS